MVVKKKNFDWKITARKVARSAAIVILTGILSVYSNEPLVLMAIPLIEGVLNWLKHK